MISLTETAIAPLGQAALDYMHDYRFEYLITERDDGYRSEIAVSRFFRTKIDMSPHEELALSLCRGRILDIGAGVGPHALILQEHGHCIHAIDICPDNVEVMRLRGIRDVDCLDIWEMEFGNYDTLLLLGHGIGIVSDLEELYRFLLHCRSLINPKGQLLVNGFNYNMSDRIEHIRYHDRNIQQGVYPGTARIRLVYNEMTGPWFNWLMVDKKTLRNAAAKTGWQYELLREEEDGNYLVKLEP